MHRWQRMALDDLITLAIELDNNAFQRTRESRGRTNNPVSRPNAPAPNPPRFPFNPNPGPCPVPQGNRPPPQVNTQTRPQVPFVPRPPANLNANTRRVTPDERNYRQQFNLCYRCGGQGHMARECLAGQAWATEVPVFDAWLAATQQPRAPVAPTPPMEENQAGPSQSGNGSSS